MDETELTCVGVNPEMGTRLVVIDFLSTPSIKQTERKTSSGPPSTAWRLALAKEIKETLT
jgi:hypothetical protein